ncbi:MAG: phosphatase PAP2 family protein [Chloroflexi bacterium]|jgi:membrane-associated phospholipid phosphatase|nr:phosphatase PAP2 family protein [Anaerolineaceae bacterium]NMB87512.1 phosphatase PAP2 family protein [Chloroflexota bacterium]
MEMNPPTHVETESILVPTLRTRTWDFRLARAISHIGSPTSLAVIGILIVALWLNTAAAWYWASFEIFVTILIPVGYVIYLLKRRRITDFDIYHRHQRTGPYILMLTCCTVTLAAMWLGLAPAILILFAAVGLIQILLMFLINLRWKISGHAAAMASFTMLLFVLMDRAALPFVLAMPLMIWSRVRLRRHTLAQTIAGTLLGITLFLVAKNLFL